MDCPYVFPKGFNIGIRAVVKIKVINSALVTVINIFSNICNKQGFALVLTGAYGEPIYPKGGYHDRGYAWDFVIVNKCDNKSIAHTLDGMLKLIDSKYRVIFHNAGNGWHYHVEYRIEA